MVCKTELGKLSADTGSQEVPAQERRERSQKKWMLKYWTIAIEQTKESTPNNSGIEIMSVTW